MGLLEHTGKRGVFFTEKELLLLVDVVADQVIIGTPDPALLSAYRTLLLAAGAEKEAVGCLISENGESK